mmetsp:Transcript_21326/g.25683  ORF Transcript_21326/g.25683 Transcript_21326/m.25683 type:complete len:1059 (+) Transcript_21326:245-3421(+)|eukprot:CAMPEP_0197844550 /NCGR_PEP_ID=MMETSP1438-20131217/1530_1 /TAXON_ID=1461541 /ORGANISM="Pterosperma sp., Strain CCMP1384" /LENGTH=1058 /DNA_ID=CAMNT_0043455385 /DNA_START=229 /DNA_END=3405 /DNA_ORIENTATION=-
MAESAYPAWAKPVPEVLSFHQTDQSKGLSTKAIEEKRAKYGLNELTAEEKTPLWKLVLAQFDDTLVKILLLAACVSFLLAYLDSAEEEGVRAYIEPFVILLILVINACVGVWQESNAENALEALKEMQSDTAKALRNGVLVPDVPAVELVPGDIVELSEGDKVPADIRVIALKSLTLQIDQALLTGESVEVNKILSPTAEEDCNIQSKLCMLFSGTAVKKGSCTGVVNSIGMKTEIGEIHGAIQKASEEEDDTPLKIKLDEFGELLTKVIGIICLLVWVINYKFFLKVEFDGGLIPSKIDFSVAACTYYFKIAVALAVAAIPEGLPAVITTCLALGTRKMAAQNAIVRKLPSVETLGCTTVICSDKTGTLTTNQMSVVEILTAGADSKEVTQYEVTGSTFDSANGEVKNVVSPLNSVLTEFAKVVTICNDCEIQKDPENDAKFKVIGQPTEAALRVCADKIMAKSQGRISSEPNHLARELFEDSHTVLATLEFDRDRKRMSVLVQGAGGGPAPVRVTRSSAKASRPSTCLMVKGQAQSVLDQCTSALLEDGTRCKMTPTLKKKIMAEVEGMAKRALRCLAVATKSGSEMGEFMTYDGPDHPAHEQLTDQSKYDEVEDELTFLGVAGLMDPPRPEVKDAVADCQKAGMRVIMITGDFQVTAEAIAKDIGIIEAGQSIEGKSFTGQAFYKMTQEEQMAALKGKGGRVFSGAQPNHKQVIVQRLKEMDEIVAMTGDGVNDAPALKLADIGVAMGIAGTEVAKEASDMVLSDDNFSTIVAAVREGRSIYNNMKAFIRYMISSNIGEVVSIFLTAATGMPEGLIPVQLLWVNLVTDGPPATALGFNPPDPNIMTAPPRGKNDVLINGWVFFRYTVVGLYVGFATVGGFAIWYMCSEFMGIDLSGDGHSTISWHQLTHWNECSTWEDFKPNSYTAGDLTISFEENPCSYFTEGKAKASTISLSILVAIEMFNALNALSEDSSLLVMPPWANPYLLVAMVVSFGLHFVILYVPVLASTFGIVPLSLEEWKLVIALAAPVCIIDEILKFFGRIKASAASAAMKKQD